MKRVAILQSNYIPWKGYFDIIDKVDEFIIYDDVKYTKNDWRNRNQLKGKNGTFWLTIPIPKHCTRQNINEVRLPDAIWQEKHWKSIENTYSRAPHFDSYADFFKDTYLAHQWEYLSDLNRYLITGICRILGIDTRITVSTDYETSGRKTERVVSLCQRVGASHYLSGPSAKDYIDESMFAEAGIELEWMSYDHYSEYNQLSLPFSHNVTVLDVIFNTGSDAKRFVCG